MHLHVWYMYVYSGQQKPKSFLEIQQEQESDFSLKGSVQSGGGGGLVTPTGNKTIASSPKVRSAP